MAPKNQKDITLHIQGKFADQLRDMQKRLGTDNAMDVVRQGLTLLYYAMGNEFKVERKNSNQTLIFKQFEDKKRFV